jgi:hypothetical protein
MMKSGCTLFYGIANQTASIFRAVCVTIAEKYALSLPVKAGILKETSIITNV